MANKVYIARETPVVWGDSGQDEVLTLNNLAASAGRVGAQHDFSTGSTPGWFNWRLTVQFDTAPVVGETVEIYLSTSDGTEEDGQVGTSDAALGSADDLANLKLIGILTVTSTDADHDMTASGRCFIPTRYVSPVIYNNTADNLQATANTGEFTLTAAVDEVQ